MAYYASRQYLVTSVHQLPIVLYCVWLVVFLCPWGGRSPALSIRNSHPEKWTSKTLIHTGQAREINERWERVTVNSISFIGTPTPRKNARQIITVCDRTVTFQLNDLWPKYLARSFTLILFSSYSVTVRGQSSQSWDEKCFLKIKKKYCFHYGCMIWRDVFLVACRTLCAKEVVSATWNESDLVTSAVIFNYTVSGKRCHSTFASNFAKC